MRPCPVCTGGPTWRKEIFSMGYQVPDDWTLPSKITWYTCDRCGMLFGDCDKTQADFDQFYIERYGYGVNNPQNTERLKQDAEWISINFHRDSLVVDFGGSGDDGTSVLSKSLKDLGYTHVMSVNAGDAISSDCDVIYASHVLEHIYDLPATMKRITESLAPDGLLIVDVPDATGLLQRWKMPILDMNTKHLNHFTLRNILDLGRKYGFESVYVKPYELEFAPCFQIHFRRLDVADKTREHVQGNMDERVKKLKELTQPVNVWGLGDIVWHLTSLVNFEVIEYIDNDPAFRGQTFNGKPIMERPSNNAPILIAAQGQRVRLIENIRKMGITSDIIEL